MASIKDFARNRSDLYYIEPEKLTIIGLDTPHKSLKEHNLFDRRALLPLEESMVLNVMAVGVHTPITIVKNGETYEVMIGRQRVKSAREANKRLTAAGNLPILVPCVLKNSLDEKKQLGIRVSENEIRKNTDMLEKAKTAAEMVDLGHPIADIANSFGVESSTIHKWLDLNGLSDEVKEAVARGEVSATAAVALKDVPRQQQAELLEDIQTDPNNEGPVTTRNIKERVSDAVKDDDAPPSLREMKALVKQDGKGKIYLTQKTKDALLLVLGAVAMPDDLKASLKVLRGAE
jgi:ParB family chromosome partitioning protein